MSNFWVRKPLKTLLRESESSGMKRHLNAWSLFVLGLGVIVGAGVFVLIGEAAANYAGPGIIFSFVIAGIGCMFAALCYAELAALLPVSGSAYAYTYVLIGEFVAWLVGSLILVEAIFSAATVSVGWSAYFTSFLKEFGVIIPSYLSTAPLADLGRGLEWTGAIINVPAMFAALGIGALVAAGLKGAARFNAVMVFVKIVAIVLFVGVGLFFVKAENFTPLIPANTGSFGHFGISGVLRASSLVFFAFIGFEALAAMAQEVKKPQRDLPIGMLSALGCSTLIYILIAFVLVGMVSYTVLGVPDPLSVAMDHLGSRFAVVQFVLKGAILAGLTSVILVMIMVASRVLYAMAHDGLIPKIFGALSQKQRSPVVATLFVTAFVMLFCGFLPATAVGELTVMSALAVFVVVCFSVLYLRAKQPKLHRPFKVPFMPWIPLIGMGFCVMQMLALPFATWLPFLISMVLAWMVYLCYGQKHSKLQKN